MSHDRIPVETWTSILEYLQRSHQRNMLAVSRFYHDIAVRLLFSSIKIFFIGGAPTLTLLAPPLVGVVRDGTLNTQSRTSMYGNRACEMLNRIIMDPKFASVVKNICVLAFATGELIFERSCLIQALRSLPHLLSFTWIGCNPPLPQDISECLPVDLRTPGSPSLHQLTHLRELQLYNYVHDYHADVGDLESLIVILDSSFDSLRRLSLPAKAVAVMPIRTFISLTELCIYVPVDALELGELDLVFRHATCLTELGLIGHIKPHMLMNLQSSSGALPDLTSFRLHVDFQNMLRDNVVGLVDFLRGRESVLRRLDLRVFMDKQASKALTQTIERFYALEVLGLDIGASQMDTATLATRLPLNLRSLRLTLWNSAAHGNPLASLVSQFEQMEFLSCLVFNDLQEDLPIDPVEFLSTSKHIELLGLNCYMWNVHSITSSEGFRDFLLEQWPWEKAKFGISADFRNIDDAWLFRYSEVEEDISVTDVL